MQPCEPSSRRLPRLLRTRLLWLLFAFGLQTAACGSAPSQPRAEQARVEQSAVLPLPSSSSATHDEGAPPTAVEIVSAPGCTIEARTIVSDYPGAKRTEAAPLRIRLKREGISGVGEPAVLTLSASKAAFAMAVGSDAAVGVTAEARGVNLAGFVAPSEVPLYVRKSHKLAGGLFTATNQTPIQLVAVQAGGLRVKVAMSDLIELVDSLDEVIIALFKDLLLLSRRLRRREDAREPRIIRVLHEERALGLEDLLVVAMRVNERSILADNDVARARERLRGRALQEGIEEHVLLDRSAAERSQARGLWCRITALRDEPAHGRADAQKAWPLA